jgi:chromosomal replication initiator protein
LIPLYGGSFFEYNEGTKFASRGLRRARRNSLQILTLFRPIPPARRRTAEVQPKAVMPRPLPLTFAHFLDVPESASARAAVQRLAASLAEGPSLFPSSAIKGAEPGLRGYNPLFLHGPAGTGKTHLVSALVDHATRAHRRLAFTLLQAGDFRRSSDANGDNGEHWPAVPDSDLVILEDVQHVPTTAAEALVAMTDELLAREVPLVCTAAVGPRWLPAAARLRSRLASGLVVELRPLQAASRLSVLQDKAQRRQLAVSREVLAWLAEHLPGNGRQMEGAVTRLEGLARMHRQPLDVALVAEHFREEVEASRPTVERISERVCQCFQVKPGDLRSGRRSRQVLVPRQVSMYLARQLTGLSLEQIGHHFGGRDHTTVLHACRKVEQALIGDPVLSGTVRQLQSELA